MNYQELAKELNHDQSVIDKYLQLKQFTIRYDNNDVSELDIIFFLQNILWSANFQLVAKIIRDCGLEGRLDQWKEEINKQNMSLSATNQQEDEDNSVRIQ